MKMEIVAAAMSAVSILIADEAPSGSLNVRLEKPLGSGYLAFSDNIRRFEVELEKPIDLSSSAGVVFDIRCADPDALTDCWLLFRTGDGYYRARVEIPKERGKWTRRAVLKSEVRLYHWNTHISLRELYAKPNPADLPDWSRVTAYQVVFSLAIDRTSEDASVSARGFSPLLDGSPECEAARQAAAQDTAQVIARIKAIPPRMGERRYLATHVWGLDFDWDITCRRLKALGITDIIPLMTVSGRTYYRSSIEPPAELMARRGDALVACLAACKRYGLGCFPWRSCWELDTGASPEEASRYARDGRLQVSFSGKTEKWFCPTHPANVAREVEGLMELSDAGADGILLDYFRYPDRDCCFCDRCRKKFESTLGRTVEDWPHAVRRDKVLAKKWSTFRQDVLTEVLRTIRAGMRRKAPKLQLVSAVAATVEGAEARGQDWPRWCREGLLDTLFTMCYYSTTKMLKRDLSEQLANVKDTKTVLCPMICFACGDIPFNDPDEVARQIQVVRGFGLPDLAFFRLHEYAPYVLELLHQGPLASSSH